ncbi:HEAT repeat domain-containing protein [Halomonas sp. ANAO-440]|uniref:HEAT repeat domain-containing protein n=1 Tax=Halomonas sp. ANAO-440 TaxID=2861360 RepID=UPI001CAA5F1F|nr:HEAT repeat domain-containing protein [Halomonas sp. ANAO-440]MBZ0330461.1 HEAT repeat domain-containing protein [Halomonas sp. ANAO-440]
MIAMACNWAFAMPFEPAAVWHQAVDTLAWMSLMPDDPVLRLAIYSALALVALTLLVMVQVLVLSELAGRRERRRRAFVNIWRPQLAMWSLSEPGSVAVGGTPRSKQEQLWFLLLWSRVQRQLRGSARERLNTMFDALGMTDWVLAMLRTRAVHRQLVALNCLRYLADVRHWSAVSPLLEVRNPVVGMAAAQALVAMDPARAMQRLIPLVGERRDWAMPRLRALCQQAGRDAVGTPLLAELESASTWSLRVVALIDWAPPSRAAPWARRCLTWSSVEEDREAIDATRCAALRCLGELRDPRDRMLLASQLDSPSPEVRLAAVQALRRQAGTEDITLLEARLADSSWWVRQAAADCLVALPGIEPERLTELLERVEDRYGRDALRRAMAEGVR